MEVTLAPAPDYLITLKRPTPANTRVQVNTLLPEPANPPAALVTLTQRSEPSPVYQEPMVIANYLRDNSYTKPVAIATSVALMQSLNQLAEKKTTFSVSSLFNQGGALSRETSEYRNEARQFYVPQKVALDKFSPEFPGSAGARVESAFLTIKTKDGDSIQIQLSRSKSGDLSQMAFSFVVDGELSDAEQKALQKLIKQESSYELINHYFEDFPKEYLDELGGSYTYTTEHEQGSVSRILSMTNDRVNNMWIEQDASKEKQTS